MISRHKKYGKLVMTPDQLAKTKVGKANLEAGLLDKPAPRKAHQAPTVAHGGVFTTEPAGDPEKAAEMAVTALTIAKTTDEENLNKTEADYLAHLREHGFAWIGIQNIKLKLADNTTYTCDFFTLSHGGKLVGREVKGFMRDDASVKIKVAAREFRWIQFLIVKKTKNGWVHKEVKP